MAKLDPFLLTLAAAVVLATFVPGRGNIASILAVTTFIMIAVMFFLQGARLDPSEILETIRDWKLQGSILACTFVLFPILGLSAQRLMPNLFTADLWKGVIFLCCLPSTVQSSIALTSIAKGNVSAAICGATVSNLFGLVATPLLVGFLIQKGHLFTAQAVVGVLGQLLLPFLLGQVLRPRIGKWVKRHRRVLSLTDRGSVVLVVYTAFSHAVIAGLWHRVSIQALLSVAAASLLLLFLILSVTFFAGRRMSLSMDSTIALMFCGSKKSLATGVPMANILFSTAHVGIVVLPLMMFHQIQLFTCTLLARKFAARG